MKRSAIGATLCALVLCATWAGPARANETTSTFENGQLTITMDDWYGWGLDLVRESGGDGILVNWEPVAAADGTIATVDNTSAVLVLGNDWNWEYVTIYLAGGPFTSRSGTDVSFDVDLGQSAQGSLAIVGTEGADELSAGSDGSAALVDLDGDGVSQVTARIDSLSFWSGGGDDRLSAAGGGPEGLAPLEIYTGMYPGYGDDVVVGGAGTDYIEDDDGDDIIDAGAGGDYIEDYGGDDVLAGGDGDDDISAYGWYGDGGDDVIDAGAGDDRIYAGSYGNDTITGGDGDDYISSDGGDDVIDAGDGDDQINAGEDNDTIAGGDGDDYISDWAGRDMIDAGAGDDEVYAGAGNDTLIGGPGADDLSGDDGRDLFDMGDQRDGRDEVNGGPGKDTVDYRARTAAANATKDGNANDGEVGEGDNIGEDVETVLRWEYAFRDVQNQGWVLLAPTSAEWRLHLPDGISDTIYDPSIRNATASFVVNYQDAQVSMKGAFSIVGGFTATGSFKGQQFRLAGV